VLAVWMRGNFLDESCHQPFGVAKEFFADAPDEERDHPQRAPRGYPGLRSGPRKGSPLRGRQLAEANVNGQCASVAIKRKRDAVPGLLVSEDRQQVDRG
jgi:hypothetical protein